MRRFVAFAALVFTMAAVCSSEAFASIVLDFTHFTEGAHWEQECESHPDHEACAGSRAALGLPRLPRSTREYLGLPIAEQMLGPHFRHSGLPPTEQVLAGSHWTLWNLDPSIIGLGSQLRPSVLDTPIIGLESTALAIVPEPSSIVLAVIALAALGGFIRHRTFQEMA